MVLSAASPPPNSLTAPARKMRWPSGLGAAVAGPLGCGGAPLGAPFGGAPGGVGLAAPQLGARRRVVVLEDTTEGMSDETSEALAMKRREAFRAKVIVNPTLTPIGDASAAFFEGCLSVAGYRAVVRRHLRVRCRGYGGDGKPVDFEAVGWEARILQHEVDHLDGVLYTDRMESRTLRRVDLLDEPLPGDHPEFGEAVVLGESSAPVRRGPGASAADDVEARVKARKNRKK